MAKRAPSKRKSAGPALDAGVRVAVFHGAEDRLQREHLGRLEAALRKEHGEVERLEFDGRTTDLAPVFDEVRSYGLMVRHKLVVVFDAEPFVRTHRDALERYCAAPVDHATLVLRSPIWRKSKLDKLIDAVGVVVKCDVPSERDAVAWVIHRAAEAHGRPMVPDAATLLVRRTGVDLDRLDAEAAKLCAMAQGDGPVDAVLVEANTTPSSDEKAWAMQEKLLAAMTGDASAPGAPGSRGALEMVGELLDRSGQPDVLVQYAVTDLCRKLALASAMREQGAGESEITKAAKVWGPQSRPFLAAVRERGAARLAADLRAALAADACSKSGLGKARRNLETLCVAMTDN
ncbi:MAG: DNA polymerase III subunit delta [Planctomycetota bacterium]